MINYLHSWWVSSLLFDLDCQHLLLVNLDLWIRLLGNLGTNNVVWEINLKVQMNWLHGFVLSWFLNATIPIGSSSPHSCVFLYLKQSQAVRSKSEGLHLNYIFWCKSNSWNVSCPILVRQSTIYDGLKCGKTQTALNPNMFSFDVLDRNAYVFFLLPSIYSSG